MASRRTRRTKRRGREDRRFENLMLRQGVRTAGNVKIVALKIQYQNFNRVRADLGATFTSS